MEKELQRNDKVKSKILKQRRNLVEALRTLSNHGYYLKVNCYFLQEQIEENREILKLVERLSRNSKRNLQVRLKVLLCKNEHFFVVTEQWRKLLQILKRKI